MKKTLAEITKKKLERERKGEREGESGRERERLINKKEGSMRKEFPGGKESNIWRK